MPGDVTWVHLPELPSGETWEIVRNYDEFVALVNRCENENIPIKRVTFDHDLADLHYGGDYTDEKTGFDCALYLRDKVCECDWEVPTWAVHSQNVIGAARIDQCVYDIYKHRDDIREWAKSNRKSY
jgi:hypothetical protein